jgi:hypothetical protein
MSRIDELRMRAEAAREMGIANATAVLEDAISRALRCDSDATRYRFVLRNLVEMAPEFRAADLPELTARLASMGIKMTEVRSFWTGAWLLEFLYGEEQVHRFYVLEWVNK